MVVVLSGSGDICSLSVVLVHGLVGSRPLSSINGAANYLVAWCTDGLVYTWVGMRMTSFSSKRTQLGLGFSSSSRLFVL